MRRKVVGAAAVFVGMIVLVQVVAMAATQIDPLFACVKTATDWRAPYDNGTCPSGFTKVEIQKAGGGGGGGTAAAPQFLGSVRAAGPERTKPVARPNKPLSLHLVTTRADSSRRPRRRTKRKRCLQTSRLLASEAPSLPRIR